MLLLRGHMEAPNEVNIANAVHLQVPIHLLQRVPRWIQPRNRIILTIIEVFNVTDCYLSLIESGEVVTLSLLPQEAHFPLKCIFIIVSTITIKMHSRVILLPVSLHNSAYLTP